MSTRSKPEPAVVMNRCAQFMLFGNIQIVARTREKAAQERTTAGTYQTPWVRRGER
jgi:hypothetical protein